MHIRVLPGNIANMIAAGEVVQRPASVVKELMENSIDAGASSVSVFVQDAGRTLIQVIDDGCGMGPEDALLCFERHATSKIASAEDLEGILTYGFRGEALASIAAVAQVRLRTRREEDELGYEVNIASSTVGETGELAVPKGCNIEVRDLFYNVPARRKFLKSDTVELKHVVSEFIHVALTRPELDFRLNSNGRDIFALKKAKSLKFRVQNLLGASTADKLVDISAETEAVKIEGFVGQPESARKGNSDQYFFVNGRYFRSPYLHKAVMKAYENLIPDKVTPSYIIYMEVNPQLVDVNISPNKTEVKFTDDSVLFQTLYACVREVLGRNEFNDSIDFDRAEAPFIPNFSKNFDEFHPVREPQVSIDPNYNPFENDGFPNADLSSGGFVGGKPSDFDSAEFGAKSGFGGTGRVSQSQNYGKLFDDSVLPTAKSITVNDKYILTVVRSGVMAIHIRRAKERILFDRFLDALSQNGHVSQQALFPEPVEVGVENMLLLEENAALLESLGFDIRPFGNDTAVVNGVPEGYSAQQGKVKDLLFQVLDALKENTGSLKETMTANMAEKFARIGAMTAENLSSPTQAQRLIDALFACANAEFTNSGRRTMAIITNEELDKKF